MLFLLCLLILGAASATDNDAIAGSDVTEDAVCINDNADTLKLSQSDDVKSCDENTQAASSSQEIFTDENGYLVDMSFNKDTSLSFDGLFCREINHFVDCVLNGTPCKAPAEDGVEIMKILDAVYESARTGHEVVIK